MASIYLIRHGQASFGAANYDCLSAMGQQQASHLGQVLATRLGAFDKVALGSMKRHKQTAEACLTASTSESVALPLEIDADWNEYDHQDILSQLNSEFATAAGVKAYVAAQDNPHKALENLVSEAFKRWIDSQHDEEYVEAWQDYQRRIQGALAKLVANLQGAKKVAVFTSGGPIALLSQHILGVPAKKLMQLNWTLLNCGVTKLITTRSGVILSSLNEHSAFEGEHQRLISYK
ncbi:MAG: broad specificity phosphatase PhoE [Paraglaciecola sp.]|jgi:broad specificity phosphatase PhoE